MHGNGAAGGVALEQAITAAAQTANRATSDFVVMGATPPGDGIAIGARCQRVERGHDGLIERVRQRCNGDA